MSERGAAAASVAWAEPTRSLPLRWGRYSDRLGLGLVLIVSGALPIAGADTYQLLALLATVPHVVGWAILPADGWRRVLVPLPSTAACWLLLTGPVFLVVLVVPYLCWMIVRQRPAWTGLVTAIIPLGTAVLIALLADGYDAMLPGLGAMAVALAVAALAARVLSARGPGSRRRPRRNSQVTE